MCRAIYRYIIFLRRLPYHSSCGPCWVQPPPLGRWHWVVHTVQLLRRCRSRRWGYIYRGKFICFCDSALLGVSDFAGHSLAVQRTKICTRFRLGAEPRGVGLRARRIASRAVCPNGSRGWAIRFVLHLDDGPLIVLTRPMLITTSFSEY